MIKKNLIVPIFGLALFFPPVANADTPEFFAGYRLWSPAASGLIADDGRSVDLNDELKLNADTANIVYISLEYPAPLLPNIHLQYGDLTSSGVGSITQELQFNGETYPVDSEITTNLDLTHTDATLYYKLWDTLAGVDLGLTARKFAGSTLLQTNDGMDRTIGVDENFDVLVPMVYGRISFRLPLTGLTADAQVNYVSHNNDRITDAVFRLNYEASFGLGIEAGYRAFDIDIEDDGFIIDTEVDGIYTGLSYRF